jgi:hypothetical protein
VESGRRLSPLTARAAVSAMRMIVSAVIANVLVAATLLDLGDLHLGSSRSGLVCVNAVLNWRKTDGW